MAPATKALLEDWVSTTNAVFPALQSVDTAPPPFLAPECRSRCLHSLHRFPWPMQSLASNERPCCPPLHSLPLCQTVFPATFDVPAAAAVGGVAADAAAAGLQELVSTGRAVPARGSRWRLVRHVVGAANASLGAPTAFVHKGTPKARAAFVKHYGRLLQEAGQLYENKAVMSRCVGA